MWILIFTLYTTPMSSNVSTAIHTVEFDTENACEIAAKKFIKSIDLENLNIDAKAICVKK